MNKNIPIMKKCLSILLLTAAFGICHAQGTHDLTNEEIQAFQIQCKERVDALQMGLEIIAGKEQPIEIRNHYIATIPEMFMGNGEPWTDYNGQRHDAVKMQVSSIAGGRLEIKDIPLKKYLVRLRDINYTSVEIKKANTCVISNFYKESDDTYRATCTFYQYFTGRRGEVLVYRDESHKEVDVIIRRVPDGNLGAYWEMKFGDINVSETRPM